MKFQASFSLIRVNVSSSFQAISEENEGNSCVVWAMDVENLTMLNKVNLIVTLPFQARGRGWNVSMLVLNYGFIFWSQFLHVLAGSWEEHLPGNLTNVWKLKVAISKGKVLCSLDACWVPQFVSSQLGGVRWHAGSAGWRMTTRSTCMWLPRFLETLFPMPLSSLLRWPQPLRQRAQRTLYEAQSLK